MHSQKYAYNGSLCVIGMNPSQADFVQALKLMLPITCHKTFIHVYFNILQKMFFVSSCSNDVFTHVITLFHMEYKILDVV